MNDRDECYVKMSNLQFRDVIGWGASGVVYLVFDPQYKREFALKSVLESKFNQNEIDSMKEVDDQNVIQLYKYDYYDGSVYLLMEHCPMSLEKYMKKCDAFKWSTIIKYSIGILKAIRACHQHSIAHLDIKPANFLIDKYDRIRVCDFGLSSKHKPWEMDSQYAGSVPFMAPEIIAQIPHDSFKADIWAIGVTLFILATGKLPWAGDDRQTLMQNSMNQNPRLELIERADFREAVGQCLMKNPDDRPTIEQLLNLPIFREQNSIIISKVHKFPILNKTCIRHHSQSAVITHPRVKRINLQDI